MTMTFKIFSNKLYNACPDNDGKVWRYVPGTDKGIVVFEECGEVSMTLTCHSNDIEGWDDIPDSFQLENPNTTYETKNFKLDNLAIEVFNPS